MQSRPKLDPAPRSYPEFITLVRRAARNTEAAPAETTMAQIEAWLLGPAIKENDLQALFQALVWRLVAAGLPLDRVSLHIGTLHPQLFGFGWLWEQQDGFCDEVQVAETMLRSDAYRSNPLFRAFEHGEQVRCNSNDPSVIERFPLLRELARQGITDYLVEPIGGGAYHNAASIATKRPGGFTYEQIASLQRVLALFAVHVERHIAQRIAVNVLDTYLGAAAARKVLQGSIQRGAGEAIDAVIWVSDLRNFTDLTDQLEGANMIVLLNLYFGILAGAVIEHGGEVLKFIGDGLLAVFPLHSTDNSAAAATAALAAARQALAGIAQINRQPPAAVANIPGWQPLRTGIALHEGEVFFGNVGAAARLDFTVIGRAVNAATRVEELCKTLGRSILITEPVARRLGETLEPLGEHTLRGLAKPLAIYSAGPESKAIE
jgi:adenylate cyclase